MQRNKAAQRLVREYSRPAFWTPRKFKPPRRNSTDGQYSSILLKLGTTEYLQAQLQKLRLEKESNIDIGEGRSWTLSHAGAKCFLDTYVGYGSPNCERRAWSRRRATFDLEPFEEVSAIKVMEVHNELVHRHGVGFGEWERQYKPLKRKHNPLEFRTKKLQFNEVVSLIHKKGITAFPASLERNPHRSPPSAGMIWATLYSNRNSFHVEEVGSDNDSKRFVLHLDCWTDQSGSDRQSDGPLFYASRLATLEILPHFLLRVKRRCFSGYHEVSHNYGRLVERISQYLLPGTRLAEIAKAIRMGYETTDSYFDRLALALGRL